jgi:hypothetical protein
MDFYNNFSYYWHDCRRRRRRRRRCCLSRSGLRCLIVSLTVSLSSLSVSVVRN